jgi:hypothetical protein
VLVYETQVSIAIAQKQWMQFNKAFAKPLLEPQNYGM